jgi:hypothetical protein
VFEDCVERRNFASDNDMEGGFWSTRCVNRQLSGCEFTYKDVFLTPSSRGETDFGYENCEPIRPAVA